jgi:hypothetical protein
MNETSGIGNSLMPMKEVKGEEETHEDRCYQFSLVAEKMRRNGCKLVISFFFSLLDWGLSKGEIPV